MNTIQLIRPDTGEPVAGSFMCCGCLRIWLNEPAARACCSPCQTCGGPKKYPGLCDCSNCDSAKRKLADTKRMLSAKVEPLWGGPVYFPQLAGVNGGFFKTIEDLYDYAEEDRPDGGRFEDWAWGCATTKWVDVEWDDIHGLLEGGAPDDFDLSDLAGIEELEAALQAFRKANESEELWEVDYSFIVPLNWAKAKADLEQTKGSLQ